MKLIDWISSWTEKIPINGTVMCVFVLLLGGAIVLGAIISVIRTDEEDDGYYGPQK